MDMVLTELRHRLRAQHYRRQHDRVLILIRLRSRIGLQELEGKTAHALNHRRRLVEHKYEEDEALFQRQDRLLLERIERGDDDPECLTQG